MDTFTIPLYRAADCDISVLHGKNIALIGYGSQARSHALNLRDSGLQVLVGLREGSPTRALATADGFAPMTVQDAAAQGDVVMVLAPDETHADVYNTDLHRVMKPGAALGFAHGLAIHYKLLSPRVDLDVILAAPKGIGPAVRSEYLAGRGVSALMGVHQDKTGNAKTIALAYLAGLGCARTGIFEATFQQECEADLFSEQAVLCGGIPALIRTGYEILVEAGFPPEIAYFECLHEAKLVVDLIASKGLSGMRDMISNTAEFGAYRGEPLIVPPSTRAAMQGILHDIQNGKVVQEFLGGNKEGLAHLPAQRAQADAHPIEDVSARMRGLIFGKDRKSET